MLWLLFALSLHADAKTVLLQGPQTSSIEYKAMLKSHPGMVSPVQEYLASHPANANRERLLALFAEAQRAFLSKSNEEAVPKFAAVLELLNADDWERADRDIFAQAYLRLAQMESAPEKRDRWLGQSLVLSDVNIASDLFPPPLLARRAELERQLPKRDVVKKLLARGWSEVLIDGRACGSGECGTLALYPGLTRVTLLSEKWIAVTKQIELAELEKFNPDQLNWASGGCESSALASAAEEFADSKVFWGLNCQKTLPDKLALKPSTPAREPLPLFTSATQKPSRFYQSPWFWAGVGAVVVAVVVASAKKSESKETSTTYGY